MLNQPYQYNDELNHYIGLQIADGVSSVLLVETLLLVIKKSFRPEVSNHLDKTLNKCSLGSTAGNSTFIMTCLDTNFKVI